MTFLVYRIHFGCRRSRVPFYALYRKFNCIKSYQPFVLSHVFHFIVHCRTSFFLIFFFYAVTAAAAAAATAATPYSHCTIPFSFPIWFLFVVFARNEMKWMGNIRILMKLSAKFSQLHFWLLLLCTQSRVHWKLIQAKSTSVPLCVHSHPQPQISKRAGSKLPICFFSFSFVSFSMPFFHSIVFSCSLFFHSLHIVLSSGFLFHFHFFLLFHFSQRKWSVVVSHVAAAF